MLPSLNKGFILLYYYYYFYFINKQFPRTCREINTYSRCEISPTSLLVCDRGAHIVSSIIHRCSTSTVRWPHMLLLQRARLMQLKIPRPLKYKVTSIGNKIQRRGIAPINNKNNKDISIFFVTQHQLSIIVKHEQKKSFIKKWHDTFTKTRTSSLQWILKQLSKCL